LIPHPECDQSEIDRRLERWRDRATKGNARMFEELLALRGLDLGSVRRGLGRVKFSDPGQIPEWTCILAECMETMETSKADGQGHEGIPRFSDDAERLPFEQILTPFVETAANRLRKQAGRAYARLENKAQAAIERMLLAWLAGPCGSALI